MPDHHIFKTIRNSSKQLIYPWSLTKLSNKAPRSIAAKTSLRKTKAISKTYSTAMQSFKRSSLKEAPRRRTQLNKPCSSQSNRRKPGFPRRFLRSKAIIAKSILWGQAMRFITRLLSIKKMVAIYNNNFKRHSHRLNINNKDLQRQWSFLKKTRASKISMRN